MKQIFQYCLVLFLSALFWTAGERVVEKDAFPRQGKEGASEYSIKADVFYDVSYYLFYNDCGELVVDLTHFTSQNKCLFRNQTGGKNQNRDVYRSDLTSVYIPNSSSPRVNSYYVFGLHKIMV